MAMLGMASMMGSSYPSSIPSGDEFAGPKNGDGKKLTPRKNKKKPTTMGNHKRSKKRK